MSPQQHQLSLLGRLLVNVFLAGAIYAAGTLLPETGFNHAIALFVLALACALIANVSVTPPKPAQIKAAKRGSGSEGSIKWFNATKGFGFIVGDDGAEVFVHYRNVDGLSKRNIKQGQRVSYIVKESDRGPKAEDVQPL